MKQKLLVVTLMLFLGATLAHAENWLHVRVEGTDAEHVSVNIPFSVVQAVLPAIEAEEFHGGRIRLDRGEINGIDLREVLKAFRESPDADFVTVQDGDETVRVSKERGMLLVNVDGDDEAVRVRLPIDVVEALLAAGDDDELDVMAALEALAKHRGDIVTVESDDESIRVWIDQDSDGR